MLWIAAAWLVALGVFALWQRDKRLCERKVRSLQQALKARDQKESLQ